MLPHDDGQIGSPALDDLKERRARGEVVARNKHHPAWWHVVSQASERSGQGATRTLRVQEPFSDARYEEDDGEREASEPSQDLR